MPFRTRATAVVIHNEKILTFSAVDPKTQQSYHFLPGGEIEPTETAPECAERECLEETGFRIEVDPTSCQDIEYSFVWNGEKYDCLTLFYRGYLKNFMQQARSAEEPEYNRGVVWISVSDAVEIFSYSDEIRDAVLGYLKGL